MTIRSQLVKLKVEKEFQRQCKPKTNRVDFVWYDHEKDLGEQYLQLISTDNHPVLRSCGTTNHIDEELSYLPVCQDAVRQRKNSEKGSLKTVTTIVGHSGLQGDRDYLKSRMKNVRDKWVTKERLLEINNQMKSFGYTKGIDVEEIMHHPTKPISLYRIKVGDMS